MRVSGTIYYHAYSTAELLRGCGRGEQLRARAGRRHDVPSPRGTRGARRFLFCFFVTGVSLVGRGKSPALPSRVPLAETELPRQIFATSLVKPIKNIYKTQ